MTNTIRILGLATILAQPARSRLTTSAWSTNSAATFPTRSGGSTAKAKAFMKVREGDHFTVPAGAQLRIVYFQGGRQETYTGPATLIAGAQASTAAKRRRRRRSPPCPRACRRKSRRPRS